ncbi:MAG TPA: amidohydrolase family protein [Bryobacteraceae bacterium]|nr:amidohydrolase family protein [Bryobacteraceae bacterium]
MIWDLHCHLNGVAGQTSDERMANLMQFADRLGIERVCVFMGVPFLYEPSPEQLREQNDQVLQAISHWHHRAFGFVYLSPQHLEFSLREFDRCVRKGPMVGIKLWVAKRAAARELDPIIQAAASMNAVIFQHTWHKTTGNLPGESEPVDVAALAARHPRVPIICGHTGGEWETGIRAIRHQKNVSADLAGFDPANGAVEMAVRELGASRVIYGSDSGGRSFASQLGKVMGADISEADRKLILGENLKRMMMPVLKRKGVRL